MSTCEDPGRLARDAYTYLHLPIIAGIIATAVGQRSADRRATRRARAESALAMILGGPALYLLGESLFRWRMTGAPKAPAPGGRGTAHPAGAARRPCRGAAVEHRRRRAPDRACGVGTAVGWSCRDIGAPQVAIPGAGTLMTAGNSLRALERRRNRETAGDFPSGDPSRTVAWFPWCGKFETEVRGCAPVASVVAGKEANARIGARVNEGDARRATRRKRMVDALAAE